MPLIVCQSLCRLMDQLLQVQFQKMAASFEYDEVGNTFYYVLVSFYALILIPSSYFFFPSNEKAVVSLINENECQCEGCRTKRNKKIQEQPWKKTKKFLKIAILIVAWILFILLVKKVSEIEDTHEEYDPYTILGLDQGAETSEVKKAYRELSKKMHPDRGGDAVLFDKIAKAYQALTDEESKENWQKYGNPDGPKATTFGIALPKWLVSKEYGVWLLAFYALVFMLILPVVVGLWWYNSIKYNVDKVLLDTTQLYYYFLHKNPKMEMNRMIRVFSGAFEFWKQYNKEIVERESDDIELPRLMRQLPALNENNKERPLSLPYALKARILVHCHLSRIPLESDVLPLDQKYILSRSVRLIEEMINVATQMSFYSQTKVSLDTYENLQRLVPMFVQALWQKNSPLMQLPHLSESSVNYLKRQKIFSCSDLAAMENEKRRNTLRTLSDHQYRDILVVLSMMPRLSIKTQIIVEGEDDAHEVTAGCVITVRVTLTRNSLLDPQVAGLEDQRLKSGYGEQSEDSTGSDDEAESKPEEAVVEESKPKRKPWEKPQQKKKAGGNKRKAKTHKKNVSANAPTAATEEVVKEKQDNTENREKSRKSENGDCSDSGSDSAHSENEDNSDYEDEHWKSAQKKPNLETKSYKTHPVHCPYFPEEKYEWWWLTLTANDKKKEKHLLSNITPCKTLVDEQTVDLRFAAPEAKCVLHCQLAVRSDSYMDADYFSEFKIEVKEAKQVVLPKYELTDEENEGESAASESEYTEDSDSEDV